MYPRFVFCITEDGTTVGRNIYEAALYVN